MRQNDLPRLRTRRLSTFEGHRSARAQRTDSPCRWYLSREPRFPARDHSTEVGGGISCACRCATFLRRRVKGQCRARKSEDFAVIVEPGYPILWPGFWIESKFCESSKVRVPLDASFDELRSSAYIDSFESSYVNLQVL